MVAFKVLTKIDGMNAMIALVESAFYLEIFASARTMKIYEIALHDTPERI